MLHVNDFIILLGNMGVTPVGSCVFMNPQINICKSKKLNAGSWTLEKVSLIGGKVNEPTKMRTILPKTTKRMTKTLKLRHYDVIKNNYIVDNEHGFLEGLIKWIKFESFG